VVPITRLPLVMAARSEDRTLKVPLAEPTETDLEPFGCRVMVLFVPIICSEPEKAMSLAVIVMGEEFAEMVVETAFVTVPVPSVVMVIEPPPKPAPTLALSTIDPLEPEEVCRTASPVNDAVIGFEMVIFPLAFKVKVPPPYVMFPEVPILADAPVVVIFKLPAFIW
jgi:hypothetical protein